MRHRAVFGVLALVMFTACAGHSTVPSVGPTPASALSLNPAPLELTSEAPAAAITAQGDAAGVQYTPKADASCVGSTGSIAVAGDGVAQTDVAGAPLMFLAVASGTPPSSCTMSVTGSDGSSASVEIDYSAITVDAVASAARLQRVTIAGGVVTPNPVTISSPTDVVMVNASGFSGLTKASVSCSGAASGTGVSALPAQFTGSQTVAIAPYGQGALSGTCTVTFTDSTGATATLTANLAAAALAKLTVSPANVQFACAGSSSPQTCTTGNVTIAETGAQKFVINTRPPLVAKGSCAAAFDGPLKMTTGNGTYASFVAGPQATVSFYGLLSTPSLSCTKVVIGDAKSQTVAVAVNSQLASGTTVATASGCTGADPLVAAPNAPHGMYVWNPYKVSNGNGGTYEPLLEQYVIGKDPALCGVSLVIQWSEVETSKGVYDFTTINNEAAPYVAAGLRVNLLFADASEVGTNDSATPSWVFTQDGVGQINCPGQVTYPNWLDPVFESDYETFIDKMAKHFSAGGSSNYISNIGYIRFGIGAGVESYPGHIEAPGSTSHPCLDAWAKASPAFSYSAWLTHTLNIVNAVAAAQSAHPDKQMMIALNYVSTYDPSNPNDVYVYPNAVAAAAAAGGVAFGTENLGTMWGSSVWPAGASTTPTACNPTKQYVNAYWCQAFNRHLGVVPFEFQPIVSPINPLGKDETMPHWLQLAMLNNAQILEIYPQDWVFLDDPSAFPSFTGSTQAQYQTAFSSASLVLGRSK